MDAQKCDPCRLCLELINGCDEILLNSNQSVIESIFLITGLQVVSNSGQCEYLCRHCRSLLDQCVEFRNTCVINDGVFRKMMTGSSHVEDCKSELQTFVVEIIKQEPIELGEPVDDASRALKGKLETNKDDVTELPKPKKNYNRKVQCQQCGNMVLQYKLKAHQEIHNPNRKKLSCPHCSKEYARAEQLKQHIAVSHIGEIQNTCYECGKSYINQRSLNEHYDATHSGLKRFACTVCGERFTRRSRRSYHQRTAHSAIRPFTCEYCDKSFKIKSELILHTRYHNKETLQEIFESSLEKKTQSEKNDICTEAPSPEVAE